MVEFNNISKTYSQVVGVENINLKVNPGELFGLIGPDGSGKTTLANLLPLEVAKKSNPTIEQAWYDTKAGNEVNISALVKIKDAVGNPSRFTRPGGIKGSYAQLAP